MFTDTVGKVHVIYNFKFQIVYKKYGLLSEELILRNNKYINKIIVHNNYTHSKDRERSGSVVECLT